MIKLKQFLTKSTLCIVVTAIWVLIFYKLTREVLESETLNFDIAIAKYIYEFRTPFLNSFFSFITEFGGSFLVVFTLLITFTLLIKKYYSQAIYFISPIGLSFIMNILIKNITSRTRPHISQILVENDYSFPSGHSSGATIFYLSLTYLIFSLTTNKIIRYFTIVISVCLVSLILFSRVYLGVHYPTDVLGGFIEGLIIFLIFMAGKLYTNIQEPKNTL